ncbi:hypothetical protein [Streptomyces sp. RPT161]|uniref:hypothetical protein n=1 Tax=Streptomyces sp. RPT161 TaxID=3015993 RepID=UPI0022B8B59B|nr:hypothetical protein [Streptomyces sp. RPT161]
MAKAKATIGSKRIAIGPAMPWAVAKPVTLTAVKTAAMTATAASARVNARNSA